MSDSTVKFVIPAALLLHGLGLVGALGALVAFGHGMSGGSWLPARSWLIPPFGGRAAALVASIFWIVSAIGFAAASMSFWESSCPEMPGGTSPLLPRSCHSSALPSSSAHGPRSTRSRPSL